MNKKIIAVPRLKQYGEHVNDHQKQIVENFTNQGYIIGVFDLNNLAQEIQNINKFTPKKFISNTQSIINLVENYIDTH